MHPNKKRILITGSAGLVGSAIKRQAAKFPEFEYIFLTRKDGDLTDLKVVECLISSYTPDYVIHAAAKVGGIGGNMAGQADYFIQNIRSNSNVIDCCHRYGVQKLLAFSSVCVFPDNLQILQEDRMHDGPPFQGNFAYAHSKRMVDVHIQALRDQHGVKNYCSIIPSNIIGTHDLYNLKHGHVLPCLIHKIYMAKRDGIDLQVWGDGKSLREFILSDDIALILLGLLAREDEIPDRLTIAGEQQNSIREIVEFLVEAADFKGGVIYDTSKPNGQRARLSDLTRFHSLFPYFRQTPTRDAIALSYKWFEENYPLVRL
jgi:GDP-L-fucose synthase